MYFSSFVLLWTALAVVVFVVLLFVRAPYGRHHRSGWGPNIASKPAWIVMESVSLLVFVGVFFAHATHVGSSYLFVTLWSVHYVHRSFVYPLRTHGKNKSMPVVIMLFAVVFNTVNASINGYSLSLKTSPDWSELYTHWYVVVGVVAFFVGMIVNVISDNQLLRLSHQASGAYQVPQGGLFQWVSCPNYLGEILQWCGWALATWSLAGVAFALWTMANLVPRAMSHHRWYKQKFADYPRQRRALLPFLL